jgi:Flavodoxin-like fold
VGHDLELNRAHIAAYANRLVPAEGLILVYPVWNEGFPAILKGFFDRVFIPGVSFTVGPDGALVTACPLWNLRSWWPPTAMPSPNLLISDEAGNIGIETLANRLCPLGRAMLAKVGQSLFIDGADGTRKMISRENRVCRRG